MNFRKTKTVFLSGTPSFSSRGTHRPPATRELLSLVGHARRLQRRLGFFGSASAAQNTDPSGFTYTDALVVETGPLPDGYTTNLRLWNGARSAAAPDDDFAPAPPPPPPYHVPPWLRRSP